ncbi:rab11 family-interacting protein 4A-like [Periophthalmus magnuspinnatus]|uniref:rab11 family-interacting protein 4A-like n=1 Tax=Periophthalmus magnuspinnatus TaxID=409849 RepID=UPI0024366DED|nr:rab11 family-interacting protein 4A-like [Periophthalmus magnuspinnatus]
MDSGSRRRSKSLSTLLTTLKRVFDILEPDPNGFVHTQHVVRLASRFGSHEQAKKLVECLDPSSRGKIRFLHFCFGVLAIKGYRGLPQKTHDAASNSCPRLSSPKFCQVGKVAAGGYMHLRV